MLPSIVNTKLAPLAKLFDAPYGRTQINEARCTRNSLKKYRIDRIVILYLQIILRSHFNFCTKRVIYEEYWVTWLIFEIAKYGSWTKCWGFFSFFDLIVILYLQITLRSHFNFCTKRVIYEEYRVTWLIFEIAKYGSWTKCWGVFFIFFCALCPPRASVLPSALPSAPPSVLPSVCAPLGAHPKQTFISDIYFGHFL